MAKVFITYPIPESGPNLLREAGHDVKVRDSEELISREELLAALKEYDAVLPLLTDKLGPNELAEAGDQLKVIANYAVGFDNIDVKTASGRGIIVTNTPDVLTVAVAEHTVTLLFAIAKRIAESDKFTREGKYIGWRPQLLLGTELAGKTLGIIGLGRIGAAVAQRTYHGFDMKIAYNDLKPNKEFESNFNATYYDNLDEMLPNVDAISLHVPLLDATKHLINAKRLEAMKESSLLVNTSRGPVIDESALVDALKEGKIRGAALDVFENEPKLTPGLRDLPNVILTPHTASATIEARSAMSTLAAQNIIAVLAGDSPLSPVKIHKQ
jgi:glyoxylate reductase